uniref:Sugar phosphate transporter domain-containing protein n=2 Tax=Manihot esculenta TaxID=3983 RepID=A0A2C9U3C0_MANES
MSENQRFQLGTLGALSLSVVSSVSIVICNKALISSLGFTFGNRNIQLSLVILLMGVGIATVTDLQLNVLGSVLSMLAVVTTCVAQIMTNTIQKKFKVSSTQLLYQSCPYQALTLFVIGPFLDGLLTNKNVFAFKYTPQVLFFIVLSCLISVSVNFSTFLVIGKTSPVTYQVLGHLKTCLVLAFGYVLLRDPFSWRNILGILIAVIGMVLYSYYCTAENQQKASEASAKLPEVKDSESDPLVGVESGSGILVDGVAPKAPVWSSNKDLHA